MTVNNLSNNFSVVTGKTIDSQSLLVMVNDARRQCGESDVRNNDFVIRIKDELEGEFYETFVKPSGTNGGRPTEVIEMTIKQALRVAARESKSVRRALVDKLEDMQSDQLSELEMISRMAAAAALHEKRIQQVENRQEESERVIEQIATGAIPPGWQTIKNLSLCSGLTDGKTRQLVKAFGVPNKKVPFMTPTGILSAVTVAEEDHFMDALRDMKSVATRGVRSKFWNHPKIGRFELRDMA